MSAKKKDAKNRVGKQKSMVIIFGSTGDLTKRKLIPAFYKLYAAGSISETPILCIGRRQISEKEFIDLLNIPSFIPKRDEAILSRMLDNLFYVNIDFQHPSQNELSAIIREKDKEYGCRGNRIFYLATPPELFRESTEIIKRAGLDKTKGFKRIVFEKPFGHDLKSATELNEYITSIFQEKEIYRIDHYLGKELVQNILTFRFANAVFEQIWNNRFIDHVQITIAESIGVEERGIYYDKIGALRDMVQNHMFQLLCLTVMEPPKTIYAEDIRNRKVSVLKAMQPVSMKDVVVGQYDGGIIEGRQAIPYRKEKHIDPKSLTETFVALKVNINNNRWKGVPFYLRTGKRLSKKSAEISIILKDVSCNLFCQEFHYHSPNVITIRIQPDEGIAIHFNTKYPGTGLRLHPAVMEFCHSCLFQENTPEAYELLLSEIIKGDQTLFTRWDWVKESWGIIDKISSQITGKRVESRKKGFPNYSAGSMGPKEADELMKRDKREWIITN